MLAAFDYKSFFSIWYWVLTVLVWTQVSHRTLGVPYDMILRAGRLPDVAAQVDAMARISAARLAAMHRTLGVWLAAGGGFALAALAVLGFSAGLEVARAAFMLILPLAFVAAQTVRLALAVEAQDLHGEALRRRLARRRSWNQTTAIAAMLAAAIVALAHHPRWVFG